MSGTPSLSVSASGSIRTLGVLSAFLLIMVFLGADWQEANIKLAITTPIIIHNLVFIRHP
jgi:hypothetical protein